MTRYDKQNLSHGTKVRLNASEEKLGEIGIIYMSKAEFIIVRKIEVGDDFWFKVYPADTWYAIKRNELGYPKYEVPSFMLEVIE